MRRRDLVLALGGLVTVLPLPIRGLAQEKGLRSVGILTPHMQHEAWPTFFRTLRELGYEDGQNIRLITRSAEGKLDRLPALAAELVAARADLIVAVNTPGAQAAITATKDIPVVMMDVADPVGAGFVATLARPGGNVTGISNQASELTAKRLSILKEAAPAARRIAILVHPDDPITRPQRVDAESHARIAGHDIAFFEARNPGDLSGIFEQIIAWRADAALWLIGQAAAMQARTVELALEKRLPTMTVGRASVQSGGLLSYYVDPHQVYAMGARQADKVLKGAKPADLAVQQPIKFELVINLKTAKRLNITISPLLLAQADEVIE